MKYMDDVRQKTTTTKQTQINFHHIFGLDLNVHLVMGNKDYA